MKAYLLVFLTLQIFTNAIKLEYIVAYYAANTRYNNFEMGIPSRKDIITEVEVLFLIMILLSKLGIH